MAKKNKNYKYRLGTDSQHTAAVQAYTIVFIVRRGALCSEFTVIGILVSAMEFFLDVLIERRAIDTVDDVITHALF